MELKAAWWARVAIIIQFLALIRTLAEYFRLQYVLQERFSPTIAAPYVGAALFTSVICAFAVILYFAARFRLVIAVGCVTVAALLAYKLVFMR